MSLECHGSLLLATQRSRGRDYSSVLSSGSWAPEQLLKPNNTWRCGVGMGWRGKTGKMAGRKRQQLTVSSQDSVYLLLPRRTLGMLPEQWHIAHCIPESPKAHHSRSQGSEFQSSWHILPWRKAQRAAGTNVSVKEMKETRWSAFVCLPEIILPLTWNLLAQEKLQSAMVVIFIRAVDDRIMTVAVLCTLAGATSSHLLSLPLGFSWRNQNHISQNYPRIVAFFGDMSPIKTDRSHGLFPHDSSFSEEKPSGGGVWGSCP